MGEKELEAMIVKYGRPSIYISIAGGGVAEVTWRKEGIKRKVKSDEGAYRKLCEMAS